MLEVSSESMIELQKEFPEYGVLCRVACPPYLRRERERERARRAPPLYDMLSCLELRDVIARYMCVCVCV